MKQKIFLLEDIVDDHVAFKKAFEKDYDVTVVTTFSSFKALLETGERPDLWVIDLVIECKSTLDFISRNSKLAGFRWVSLSNNGTPDVEKQARSLGAMECIKKSTHQMQIVKEKIDKIMMSIKGNMQIRVYDMRITKGTLQSDEPLRLAEAQVLSALMTATGSFFSDDRLCDMTGLSKMSLRKHIGRVNQKLHHVGAVIAKDGASPSWRLLA